MSLLSTSSLRSILDAVVDPVTDCDGVVGPALRAIGLAFSIRAATTRASAGIAQFVSDTKSSVSKFKANEDLRKALLEEIEKLNPLDTAYSNEAVDSLFGRTDPFSSRTYAPDSLQVNDTTGGFGLFEGADLVNNLLDRYAATGMQIESASTGNGCSPQIAGNFAQPVTAALDQTTRPFRRAASTLAGIGMAIAQNPQQMLETSLIAATELLDTSASRRTLLESMKSQITNVVSLLSRLTDSDYLAEINQIISDARQYVEDALSTLNSIITELSTAGDFNKTQTDTLKEQLLDARKALEEPPFPSVANLEVYPSVAALLVVLNQMTGLLKNYNPSLVTTVENLSRFTASLNSNIKVSNHFGSMFTIIRCRLKIISEQMTGVQQMANPVMFHLKAQEWRILLEVYRKMVDLAAQDPVAKLAGQASSDFSTGVLSLESAIQGVQSGFVSDALSVVPSKVRTFISRAQAKLKTNLSQTLVEFAASDAIAAIDADIANSAALEGILDQFIGDWPGQKASAEAFTAVLLVAPELYALGDAVKNGDVEQFFNIDPQANTLDGVVAKLLEAAAKCSCESRPDPVSQATAANLRREADQRIQEDRLNQLDESRVASTSTESQESAILEIRVLKQRLRSLRALFQSPCFDVAEQLTVF